LKATAVKKRQLSNIRMTI